MTVDIQNSKPMTESPKKIRYAEDVKETFHVAEKLAKKRRPPSLREDKILSCVRDREYLMALLMVTRAFSRPDALFRQMGIKPKELYRAVSTQQESRNEPLPESPEGGFLKTATDAMDANADKMEVDHLLIAFSRSDDPVVRQACEDFGITPERIEQARRMLAEKSVLNVPKSALFSALYLIRELVEVVVIVLFFLIVIKEGFGELRLIPSESMLPTLQVEDRLVIEKVSRWWRTYERGDILVFYPPPPMAELKDDPLSVFLRMTGFSSLVHNTADDPIDKAYIKRLVGMPGDTIQVVPYDGVYINGEKLYEPYVNEVAEDCGKFCLPRTVPEEHYFMMGDNRNDSRDSRYFGFQPQGRVVGRAVFRIWPPMRAGVLDSAG